MRFVFSFLVFSCFSLCLSAQSTISAEKIIAQLNAGTDVALTGVTITGDLDFTLLDDREETQKGGWGSQQQWKYHVRNSLSFVDCTFEGNVWAYRVEGKGSNWKSEPVHIADFHEDVLFRNCKFEEDVNFKYTRFHEKADFPGADFEEAVGFKYTEFNEPADFSGIEVEGDADFKYTKFDRYVNIAAATFKEEADFKYTKFPRGVDLSDVVFEDDAVFKYAEFPQGVNLANTRFRRDADFKYTKFSSPANFDGTDFGNDADFKYTSLDGRDFKGR
ncbi:pentapeptide repeat-containing protein [Neolewinella aurantiaca]|nr:pentapeptide repeat-containing protein [Neolewinella aurantiaca]